LFEGRATPKTSDTVLFIAHDITERKNADEKIRESEEKLRSFMNTTTIGVWCFKPEFPIDITQPNEKQIDEFMKSVCIECNETYAIMMGTTKDKIIGIMLSEVLPDCEETREYFIEFIKGGYKLDGGETHEISKTGEEKYFSNSFLIISLIDFSPLTTFNGISFFFIMFLLMPAIGCVHVILHLSFFYILQKVFFFFTNIEIIIKYLNYWVVGLVGEVKMECSST